MSQTEILESREEEEEEDEQSERDVLTSRGMR